MRFTRSTRGWLRFVRARSSSRWLASLLAAAAYFASFPLLAGVAVIDGARVFVLVPIAVTAWAFGLRGGLIGGAILLVATGVSTYSGSGLELPSGGIERFVGAYAIGVLVGWLSDLRREAAASNRMYAALVENGPGMTYVWSSRTGIKFISSNAEAMTGYTAAEWKADYAGVVVRQLDPADHATLAEALETLRQTGKPMRASVRVRRPDGSVIWVDHNADCIERDGDDVTIQGTVIDVTARYEVADALARSRMAQSESETKSRFLASASHELRTPLNSILGFATLLQTNPASVLDSRQARFVANIRSSGEHLLSLINDLLDISRVEVGRIDLNYVEVDLGELVADAIAQVAPLSDQKGLSLRAIPPERPLVVRADRRRLLQILLNLLSNAVKFTESGSVVVTCEVGEDRAAVRVTDTGPGIPA